MDIVLLHGGPGADCEYLAPLAEMLGERFTVHLHHQRALTVRSLVDELENLRIELDLDHWWVAGHSWGASLALAYTAQYGARVDGLLLLSGTGITLEWLDEYRAASDSEVHPPIDVAANRALNASWTREVKSPQLRDGLARFAGPVVMIHGERDPRPSWPSRELVDIFPHAKLELMKGAGHYPWRDAPAALHQVLSHVPSDTYSRRDSSADISGGNLRPDRKV